MANGVHARVAGLRVERVWTSGKPQTFKSPEEEIAETLTGARIERVRRVGKTVVMDLGVCASASKKQVPYGNDNQNGNKDAELAEDEAGNKDAEPAEEDAGKDAEPASGAAFATGSPAAQLLVHLGMTGRLLVNEPEVPRPTHTHLVLSLSDGRELRFADPRRFGRLSVVREPAGYAGPGAEPTTVAAGVFRQLFRGRKLAIKAALLNQSLLHGIGNIYADEALFRAGIRPRKAAGRLTRSELARLDGALKEVLARAIELGGSSVSDYVDADGVRGFFQLEHKVYGRAGEPCAACQTVLKKSIVGGRTTVYCSRCQR